jgi:hypothetical protein
MRSATLLTPRADLNLCPMLQDGTEGYARDAGVDELLCDLRTDEQHIGGGVLADPDVGRCRLGPARPP